MTDQDLLNKVNEAIKEFGEYSYYDKGASEVMNISKIAQAISDEYKTPQRIKNFLEKAYKKDKDKMEPVVFDLIFHLIDHKLKGKEIQKFTNYKFIQNFYGEKKGGMTFKAVLAADIFSRNWEKNNFFTFIDKEVVYGYYQ